MQAPPTWVLPAAALGLSAGVSPAGEAVALPCAAVGSLLQLWLAAASANAPGRAAGLQLGAPG